MVQRSRKKRKATAKFRSIDPREDDGPWGLARKTLAKGGVNRTRKSRESEMNLIRQTSISQLKPKIIGFVLGALTTVGVPSDRRFRDRESHDACGDKSPGAGSGPLPDLYCAGGALGS
jgi:hypothetical protein